MRANERLAVYTTIYPGALRFLGPWADSVRMQSDRAFDLWVGLDGVTPDCAGAYLAGLAPAFVSGRPGASPGQVRTQAMEQLVDAYDAVVFVDSDDLLAPNRVAAARAGLEHHDVYACALDIMDERAVDVGCRFEPPPGTRADRLLPRYNVFGLSNTAYRTAALRRCLPVPRQCHLVDWLLATRAWLAGARMTFDSTPHMRYRQYSQNVAQVVGPFTPAYVATATGLVLAHYRAVREGGLGAESGGAEVVEAQARVASFAEAMAAAPDRLDTYTRRLNELPRWFVWWWCVAHPDLEMLWNN